MALLADALTASRILMAVLVGWMVGIDRYDQAIVILMVAWLTDFLDGRFARRAAGRTRLGAWDFRVDVTLGVAILVGLVANNEMSIWVLLTAFALGVGWTRLSGNPAPAMLMMGLVYGWFLAVIVAERPGGWWLPLAVIPVLLAVDHRRFFNVILPAFFNGIARLTLGKSTDPPPVLDLWATTSDEGS